MFYRNFLYLNASLFDQGLFNNQGGLGFGQVSMAIMFNPHSKVFDKSHDLASHVFAICLYYLELEASFDLLRGKFLYVFYPYRCLIVILFPLFLP